MGERGNGIEAIEEETGNKKEGRKGDRKKRKRFEWTLNRIQKMIERRNEIELIKKRQRPGERIEKEINGKDKKRQRKKR